MIGKDWSDFQEITNASTIQEYLKILTELDAALLSEVSKTDDDLIINAGDEIFNATRSLILSQAVMHAAEHKSQIATILKQHGHHLGLDALDVWTFVSSTKE